MLVKDCDLATKSLDAWLRVSKRFSTESEHGGFLMLKGSEIRVGPDLNYEIISKDIQKDFLLGEARTDIAIRSFTDDDISVRSAAVIHNQNRLNLDVLRQVYHIPDQRDNGVSGSADRQGDEVEQRLRRAFKICELCDVLSDNKIQAIRQIGSVEALEKELEQVAKKNDVLGEKCEETDDVDFIVYEDQEYEVSTTLRIRDKSC